MSRLKDLYKNEIMDAMTKKFGYKNVMEVPKLEKIVVNMGVGEAKENAKLLDAANRRYGTCLQDRKQSLQKLKSLSLTSKSERVCQSDVKLL